MKKMRFLAAAAAVTALVATPALAQDTAKPSSEMQGTSAKPMKHKHSAKHAKHMKHSARMQSRDGAYMRTADNGWGDRAGWSSRDDWNNRGWDNRGWDNRGFWPADVVGGAVGTAGAIATGAVATAGAIATAPFGGPYRNAAYRDSYAFDGGYGYGYGTQGYDVGYNYDGVAIPQSSNYAARNGFVCQPGTVTRAKNGSGVAVLCQ